MAKEKLVKKTLGSYTGKEAPETPLRAIRTYCVKWCMNNSAYEVDACTATDCELYIYRFGKNPRSTRTGNTDGLKKAQDALRMKATGFDETAGGVK